MTILLRAALCLALAQRRTTPRWPTTRPPRRPEPRHDVFTGGPGHRLLRRRGVPQIEADDDRRARGEAARSRTTLDEESKEGPDDELSASRHAKPVAPVEAVPEKVRAVSFDIEQPVVSPLTESRASASKWSLAKPST